MRGIAGKGGRRAGLALAVLTFGALTFGLPRPAPATIAEQRARLPPAAECGGELVAGVWRSHKYNERYRDWSIFTLNIERVPGQPNRLVGRIRNHMWGGSRADEEPPACSRQTSMEWIVSMDAVGTVRDETHIQFHGIGQWRVDEVRCRRAPWGYNLDNFSGEIDPRRLEFQSVNNDGGRAVNEPNVFRRIRCPPEQHAQSPNVNLTPPAFYPTDTSGGCGWPF